MELNSQENHVPLSLSRKVMGVIMLVAAALLSVVIFVVGAALAASQVSAPLLIFVCGLAASAVSSWLPHHLSSPIKRKLAIVSFYTFSAS